MAISKKILLLTLMATMVSFATYSEEQPETAKVFNLAQSLRNTGDFLAESLKKSGNSYEKFSEKVQPYCNPVSMAATAFGASFLTKKQFTALTIAALGGIYSKNISDMIRTQAPVIQKTMNEKLEQLDQEAHQFLLPHPVQQDQNNSDQKTE